MVIIWISELLMEFAEGSKNAFQIEWVNSKLETHMSNIFRILQQIYNIFRETWR